MNLDWNSDRYQIGKTPVKLILILLLFAYSLILDVGLDWACHPLDGFGKSCFKDPLESLPANQTSFAIDTGKLSHFKFGHAYVFNLTASSNSGNASTDQVVSVKLKNDSLR